MVNTSALHCSGTRSFPCRARCIYFVETCIMWTDRRLNFLHSVVFSVLIVVEWVILAWRRKGLFAEGQNHVHVWRSYRNFWMHLGEYLVHAWLDLVKKLQKYTSFAYSWSTSVERKKKDAFYISNWGSGIDRMERYQIIKAGTSVGAGFHNVLREKKEATIALCGLSVKRQLFCDFVRWHISRGPQNP